jgi:alpha-tubulin suppressor-like RCC1 family protein
VRILALALVVVGCSFHPGSEGRDGRVDDGRDGASDPDGGSIPARSCTLVLGSDHSCIRRHADSSVWCFGSDAYGELGNGAGGGSTTAIQVPLGAAAPTAASRFFHACAGLADGTARCWGQNDRAQIGDGTTTPRPSPTVVSGLADVMEIGAARTFNCARRADTTITCWGENLVGQLGDGSFTSQPTPTTTVTGLPHPPTAMFLGASHGCARLSDATGWCWGANAYGRLGDGTTTDRNAPVLLPITNVAQIAPGGYSLGGPIVGAQTCVLRTDHTVWCWGSNEFGQLGNGAMSAPVSTPAQVSGVTDAVELVMGRYHVCARRTAGAVACWGRNEAGELGDGTTTDRPAPVAVALPRPAIHIGAGGYHTCALLDDNSISCWGNNASGQLGDGSTMTSPDPVVSTNLCQ